MHRWRGDTGGSVGGRNDRHKRGEGDKREDRGVVHVLRERGVIRLVVSIQKTHFVCENNYHTETSVTIIKDTKLGKRIRAKAGHCCRGKGVIQVVVGGK